MILLKLDWGQAGHSDKNLIRNSSDAPYLDAKKAKKTRRFFIICAFSFTVIISRCWTKFRVLNYRSKMKYIKFIVLSLCFFSFVSIHVDENFPVNTAELSQLKNLNSSSKISIQEIQKWNSIAEELIRKNSLQEGGVLRLRAYLFNAQNAFANASFALKGSYEGSLDPISFYVLKLFFPNINESQYAMNLDPFSKKLTKVLTNKIDVRFEKENSQLHPIVIVKKEELWYGSEPFANPAVPSMIPWVNESRSEFIGAKPPPPNDKFWLMQLEEVKKSMANANEEQKKRVLFWAGKSGPDSGDWFPVADKYMASKNVPVEKRLEVRAKLATAMHDAIIGSYISKYLYLVKRPVMLDSNLKPYLETPNHPSYPSNHSTTSAAAAVILSYYFPENKQEWQNLAEEAGLSRIWAGIHFPIDHAAGKALGEKIGKMHLPPN